MGTVSVSTTGTGNATLRDANTLILGNSTVGGTLTLNADVVLASNVTLTGNVVFNGLVDAATAGSQGLSVVGNATFNDRVGSSKALKAISITGNTTLNAGGSSSNPTVKTTLGQQYGDAGTDQTTLQDATVLTSTGGGNIVFSSRVDGNETLAVNTAGSTQFLGRVGNATRLASITTDGPGGTVVGTDVVKTNGDQTYRDNVTLTTGVNFTGDTIQFDGSVSGGGNSLTVTGDAVFGNAATDAISSGQLLVTGDARVHAGTVTTAGNTQRYQGEVTLENGVNFTGSSVQFDDRVLGGGNPLTVTGNAVFNDAVTSGDLLVTGLTTVNATSITTTGATQRYQGNVTLGADVEFTGSTVRFDSAVAGTANGQQQLDISGNAIFGGPVGTTAVRLQSVSVSGTTTLNGGSAFTTGDQTYHDAVTLGADTTLTAANVIFRDTVDATTIAPNAQFLEIQGNVEFGGLVGDSVALESLKVTGDATFNAAGSALHPSVKTIGGQQYGNDPAIDQVTLGTTTVLTSTAGGDITFASLLDGGRDLAVNTSGITSFLGVVGGNNRLRSLTTDAPGTTRINGGAVTTTGDQTYHDAVTLGADTTLSAANVTFEGTLNDDGAAGTPSNLSIDTSSSGLTTFAKAVGVISRLSSLTTNLGGTTRINGGAVATTGDQTYNEAVTLGANTTLSGANVTFNQRLNDDGIAGTPSNLTINTAGNGVTKFADPVGSVDPLSSLTTNADGKTEINGGEVTTTGDQTYHDAVTLGANATLSAANVTFNATLDDDGTTGSPSNLTVNTSGNGITRFGGTVGAIDALSSLTTNADGTTEINGGAVTTEDEQTYHDAVTVGADATLTGSGLTFDRSVNDDGLGPAASLLLNTTGNGVTTFSGEVGTSRPLASVTTNADGETRIDGGAVTTTGNQTYHDEVTIGADTILTAANVTFNDELNDDGTSGTPSNLVVNTLGNGVTTFAGEVGTSRALTSLTTNADGVTRIDGGQVKTTGAQTYHDAVTLGADATLTAANVTFNGALDDDGVDPPANLTIDTVSGGVTAFNSRVGNTAPLGTLSTNADGTTTINTDVVKAAVLDFGDDVVIATDTTLTGTKSIDFAQAVDSEKGEANDLFLNSPSTTFGGRVGNAAGGILGTLRTDAAGTTTIDTDVVKAAVLDFDDRVVIAEDATLTGTASIDFAQTVDSQSGQTNDLTLVSPSTTFNGRVGDGPNGELGTLQTDSVGTTTINTDVVKADAMDFDDAVLIAMDTVLTARNSIDFAATVNSERGEANDLTLNSARHGFPRPRGRCRGRYPGDSAHRLRRHDHDRHRRGQGRRPEFRRRGADRQGHDADRHRIDRLRRPARQPVERGQRPDPCFAEHHVQRSRRRLQQSALRAAADRRGGHHDDQYRGGQRCDAGLRRSDRHRPR